uniref:Uncharacterized protein n=1 Tax=Chaetoceros debilis TaxID=122233 RepID=A0A7S3QG77_9STRA
MEGRFDFEDETGGGIIKKEDDHSEAGDNSYKRYRHDKHNDDKHGYNRSNSSSPLSYEYASSSNGDGAYQYGRHPNPSRSRGRNSRNHHRNSRRNRHRHRNQSSMIDSMMDLFSSIMKGMVNLILRGVALLVVSLAL